MSSFPDFPGFPALAYKFPGATSLSDPKIIRRVMDELKDKIKKIDIDIFCLRNNRVGIGGQVSIESRIIKVKNRKENAEAWLSFRRFLKGALSVILTPLGIGVFLLMDLVDEIGTPNEEIRELNSEKHQLEISHLKLINKIKKQENDLAIYEKGRNELIKLGRKLVGKKIVGLPQKYSPFVHNDKVYSAYGDYLGSFKI